MSTTETLDRVEAALEYARRNCDDTTELLKIEQAADEFRRFRESPSLPTVDLERLEMIAVQQALSDHGGNRTRTAEALSRSIRWLQRRIKTAQKLRGSQIDAQG